MGMVCTLIFFIPGGGDLTKEPRWTFDIDYITQDRKCL